MVRERWRYRCPRGHASWRSRSNDTFYCRRCLDNGYPPRFDKLVDVKDPSEKHVRDPDVTAVGRGDLD